MIRIVLTLISSLLVTTLFAQGLIERGPYLQSLAPNSIKIVWRTNDVTDATVEIAMSPNSAPIMVKSNSNEDDDHIVLIDGLLPKTTYYYRLKAYDTYLTDWDERYHFTTSPAGDDELDFWVIGDFGSGNQKQIDVREAFERTVEPDYPDFWLWLGDNAYNDGTDREYQDKVFTPPYGYDSLLTFMPFYAVPGNHDYKSVNAFDAPSQQYGPYFKVVEVPKNGEAGGTPSGTELYYSFDYGNAHFVALNSEAFALTFFRNTDMSKWLKQDLAASDKLWKILFWHQPPYSKGSHDNDDFYEIFMKAMRENYNPILERLGADMVLCGHSHVYERSHLINGHYGKTPSFKEHMFIDNEEPYEKYLDGDSANLGTMYVVVGNSGKSEDEAPGGHPIFAATDYGNDAIGSLLVNIEGNKLTGKYIRGDGTIADEFLITKSYKDSSNVVTNIATNLVDGFKVYPNPANKHLNVDFSLMAAKDIKVSIINAAGQEIAKKATQPYGAGQHNVQFNLEALGIPSGTYIVKVESLTSNGIQQEKIIIQE